MADEIERLRASLLVAKQLNSELVAALEELVFAYAEDSPATLAAKAVLAKARSAPWEGT